MGNFLGCKKDDDDKDESKIQTIDGDVDKKADEDVDKKAEGDKDITTTTVPQSSTSLEQPAPSAPPAQSEPPAQSQPPPATADPAVTAANPEAKFVGGGTRKKKRKTRKGRKGSLRRKGKTRRKPRKKSKRKTKNLIKY